MTAKCPNFKDYTNLITMFLKIFFTAILILTTMANGFSQTTQLKAAFCPTTVSSLGTNIRCNGVAGAEGYRFEIWDQTQSDSIKTYDSYANNRGNRFRFSWVGGGVIEYSTTYAIRVSWYDLDTDTWSAPGAFCEVTTPSNPFTQLDAAFCGAEIATESTNILCNQVTGAVEYRFEVSIGGAFLENVDKTTYKLRLSDFTSPGHPQHCTQYDIRVATRTTPTGAWSAFGASCFVTFKVPTTVISPVYCGTTINYLQQDTIHANALGVADGYRFRIESGGTIIEDTVANPSAYNGITFRKFPGVQYGQTYNVSVKIRSNGCWGEFGTSCAISTVLQPETELRPANCGATNLIPATNLYGNSIIYAQEYEYRINGGVLSNEIYNTSTSFAGIPTSPRFRLAWLDNSSLVSYGTTYSIEARVKVGGVFGAWGPACNVTLQGTPVTELKPAFCGISLASMGTNLYCNTVSLSQGYKFEVRTVGEDLVGEYDGMAAGTSSKFRINWVPGVAYNTTYRVRAAWNDGTSWSSYGSFCEVTTPVSAIIISSDDELEEETFALKSIETPFDFQTYPNPFKSSFRMNLNEFNLTNTDLIDLVIFDMQGRIMENNVFSFEELSTNQFGQNYNPGTYIIRLNNSGKIFQQRVIKIN